MNPLIVRKSRWRNVIPLAGSSAVVGISMYYLRDHEPTWLSWASVGIFGFIAVGCLGQILESKASLVISDAGICLTHLNVGTVSWSDLSGAFIQRDGEIEHICFTLRNSEEFRARIGGVGRAFNSATQQAGYGDFTFKPAELGLETRVVFELVRDQIELAKSKPTVTTVTYRPRPD